MKVKTATRRLVSSALSATVFSLLLLNPGTSLGGVIENENRRSLSDHATQEKIDLTSARQRFGASGRIMCPFNAASAFLVHRNDIVVTARHNLFPEKEMRSYAGKMSISRCGFEVTDGETSKWYQVDVNSFVYPDERQRSIMDRFDWVVMRLKEPARGVTPYKLSEKMPVAGAQVTMVTVRQEGFMAAQGWNDRIVAKCKLRHVSDIDNIAGSGLHTDCSATVGASGGALLVETPDGPEVIGVMSSTSANCKRYDRRSCNSFLVGIYGQVKEAIRNISK